MNIAVGILCKTVKPLMHHNYGKRHAENICFIGLWLNNPTSCIRTFLDLCTP